MGYYGLLWVIMEYYGLLWNELLWIIMDYNRLLIHHGLLYNGLFLWVIMNLLPSGS